MKKYFYLAAVMAVAMTTFTSCDDDDNNTPSKPVEISEGVYVINAGNKGASIDGSLTYYNYTTGAATQEVYKNQNGTSLGITVNDAVIYGSKAYILGDGEKSIFVVSKKNAKSITRIPSTVDNKAATPRHCIADGGYVYVSTYSNKVLVIDTLTNSVTKTYDCGSYSEGMAIQGGFLYVADSDYGNGNATISKIDLKSGKTETIKNDYTKNVVDIKAYNGRLFFLDSGSYDENWNQSGQGVYELMADGSAKRIVEATEMCLANGMIYTINAPYTYPATAPSYGVYDIAAAKASTFCQGTEIAYPAKVSVDALKGIVYITSYNIVDGKTSYKTDGYCTMYKLDGSYQGKFNTGVGPGYVVVNK